MEDLDLIKLLRSKTDRVTDLAGAVAVLDELTCHATNCVFQTGQAGACVCTNGPNYPLMVVLATVVRHAREETRRQQQAVAESFRSIPGVEVGGPLHKKATMTMTDRKKSKVTDLATFRQRKQLSLLSTDQPTPIVSAAGDQEHQPPEALPRQLKGGRRLHVLGYCKVAEEAAANVELVLEPMQAVRRRAGIGWAWVDGLCPSCRQMGGVLLFNRCISERLSQEKGEEPHEIRQKRLDRRVAWFTSRVDKEKKSIDFFHSRMIGAKKRLDEAAALLATDVDLP